MADVSPTFERLREMNLRIAALEQTVRSSSGSGSDGMEPRVAKLEASVQHIESDIRDIKTDVRGIKTEAQRDFRLIFGAIIAVALGLAGLMAKGFHWL
jgi:hypothetical protein